MCRRASCEKCKKTTFTGCGRHIEEILGGVSESERCRCLAAGTLTTRTGPSMVAHVGLEPVAANAA